MMAALVVLAGACSMPNAEDVSGRSTKPEKTEAPAGDEVESFMARYSTVIKGKFGTSDTSAYEKIDTARVSDMPYGPEDGVLLTASSEGESAAPPTEMPGLSRVVVRGHVLAISPPHFNSLDGSFWHPALHEEPGVTDVDEMILRDALFQVDEVWGTLLPQIVPGTPIRFVVRGGQVAVTLSDEVASQLEYGPGGVYIFGEDPAVDVSVGEYAVLFLDVRPIFGLYSGKYGARFELAPAMEGGFKYIHKDPDTIGLPDRFQYDISESSIQSIIQQDLGRKSDYRDAKLGLIYPLGPHPPGEGERAPIVGVSP